MATYRPKAKVTVTPLGTDRSAMVYDISDDIVSVVTYKKYGETGNFSITLPPKDKYSNLYENIVFPGNLVTIDLDEGAGKGFVPVMLGLVTSVEASFQVANRQHQKKVVVTGQDLKKILDNHHCFYFGAIKNDNAGSGVGIGTYTNLKYGSAAYIGKLPAEVIPLILENELYEHLPWTSAYIRADKLSESGWAVAIQGVTPHNTIWSALKMASDEPYNKLHCDTGLDGRFHIILEKCPFSNVDGKLERTLKDIAPEDVVSTNLGVNDHDHINYIWHKVSAAVYNSPDGSPLIFLEGDTIKFNSDLIKIHGFRPWYPESKSNPFVNKEGVKTPIQLQDAPAQIKTIRDRTLAFWNWYKDNHTLSSGLITIHGKPDLKAGEGICLNEHEYFVESVSQIFSIGVDGKPSFTANMHVTRGRNK